MLSNWFWISHIIKFKPKSCAKYGNFCCKMPTGSVHISVVANHMLFRVVRGIRSFTANVCIKTRAHFAFLAHNVNVNSINLHTTDSTKCDRTLKQLHFIHVFNFGFSFFVCFIFQKFINSGQTVAYDYVVFVALAFLLSKLFINR